MLYKGMNMAESMTGYGRGEKTIDGCRFLLEIKSVNNRFGDVQVRSPRVLMFLESKIKDRIMVAADFTTADLESHVKSLDKYALWTEGRTVVKIIAVAGKLVNIVVR